MKCAECGRENLDDAKFCSYCACPLVKESEITDTGSALRKIYNDFGYEKVFEDHRFITSALGDFVPDSEMISNSIEMAYRAGLGKVYEAQIRKGGKPNEAFYKRVKDLITEDAGLSEKRANQIINYFDEMLGWGTQDIPDSVPFSEPIVKAETNETIFMPDEPEKPVAVNVPKPESKPEIVVSEEPVMPEPEDEVLAALADEGIRFENADISANPESEPDPVEILSEEDPIRSIPQEQALAELQPEDNVQEEPDQKPEKLFLTVEENKAKRESDSNERKRNAKGKKGVNLAPVVIIIACIAFVIVWTIVIKPSTTQESSSVIQESSSVIQESSSVIQESSNTQSKEVSLSKAEIGSHIFFGSYEQDNDTSNGKEDIEWIVLAREGDHILVISKYALDCQKYNNSYNTVTWETCSLRKWLNETFLNTAFSSEERGKIPVVTVSADKNTSYSTNPGNATTDQVFLLSIKEANSYFSSDSARACQGTTYCYAKGAYMAGNGNCWWWLRSPGNDSYDAAHVHSDGYVSNIGYDVDYGDFAVRPAMWIDIGQNTNNTKEPKESSNTQSKVVSLSKAEIGSHVFFGSYEQDNDTSNGKEDIEWIVLDRQGDRIFVISRYALYGHRYSSGANVTWETCSLRNWLNGTFLNTAFSDEERGKIPLVTISADKNPTHKTNPGNVTTDQIFLLSITEANKYFSLDSAKECQGTSYCYSKDVNTYSTSNCRWWLRSPGYSSDYAAYVDSFGHINNYGYIVNLVNYGVRPAMWIDIGS